jgi:hypothetical protein
MKNVIQSKQFTVIVAATLACFVLQAMSGLVQVSAAHGEQEAPEPTG